MDFYGSTILWIYKHVSTLQMRTEYVMNSLNINESINQESMNMVQLSSVKINDISVGDLFYDGAWQKPIKGIYWKHNNSLWANATQ